MRRDNGFKIMARLIGLVKPLIHIMVLAILLGTLGYLCAIFITILATQVIVSMENAQTYIVCMIIIALLRGFLHYAEQYCNHYIAFKLLAMTRHHVFIALRKLCPAKLEGKDKGNLISIITTDIELLEVFYAHTISPIMIAILVSSVMVFFIGSYDVSFGCIALLGYVSVGVFLPIYMSRQGKDVGMNYRNEFGQLNATVLDSLRGIDETIQYGQEEEMLMKMNHQSKRLSKSNKRLSDLEQTQRSLTNALIYIFSLSMFGTSLTFGYDMSVVLTVTVAMLSSFGPVVALSNLSNNLNQTLASGQRVLDLLDEQPIVEEIKRGENVDSSEMSLKNVTFKYTDENILENFSAAFKENTITGIHGPSGTGKSTILKLLMRFWDPDQGSVNIGSHDIKAIATSSLRNHESYVTQETQLFHDTIGNNIAIGKLDATMEEIIEAAKKASIHDFIMSLPEGYDTQVGELGDTLSGGERQRIGIARAFLHDAPILLMDEPTSNLDALNEGIILKTLKEESQDKTIILVSHRLSTMRIADETIEFEA